MKKNPTTYDLNGNLVFKSWKNFMVTDKKTLAENVEKTSMVFRIFEQQALK